MRGSPRRLFPLPCSAFHFSDYPLILLAVTRRNVNLAFLQQAYSVKIHLRAERALTEEIEPRDLVGLGLLRPLGQRHRPTRFTYRRKMA